MAVTPLMNNASTLSPAVNQLPPVPDYVPPTNVEMWNQSYPSEPGQADWTYSIIEVSTGGFLITGYVGISGYGAQLCSMRTDNDGNQLWNFTLPKIAKYAWNDVGYAAIEVSTGGFAIAGYTMAPSGASQDMWLIRLDSTGNHLWNKTYGGAGDEHARSVIECTDGGFAMAGASTSFGIGTIDPYLVRTNSTGHLQWERTYGTDAANEAAKSVVACSTGGFALIGHYGALGMWLQRTNATGYPLWNKTYGGHSNYLYHGIETKDGGFAIAGDTWGSTGTRDAWLVRTNSTGHVLWQRVNGNIRNNSHQPKLVLECTDGGLAMYGTWEWSGMWIDRVNSTGAPLWNTTYGSWSEWAVECQDGGYALVGVTAKFSGDDDWWLVRVAPIQWSPPPEDKNMECGTSFRYDLNVTSAFTMASWSLNTSDFTIDSNGVITNAVPLYAGKYGIRVKASDEYGEFLYGSFTVTAVDTTAPTWDQTPSDQGLEFGSGFLYDVDASDFSGIHHYWVNDTTHFDIDAQGVITNAMSLNVGAYGLQVRAYDPFGLYCEAEFKVTVSDTTPPTWDQTPSNRVLEYGLSFRYDLNASDLSGIDDYTVNNTAYFAVNSNGVLTSLSTLPVGVYWLQVRAYDPYGLYCVATFSVTVQDTTPPTWLVVPTDRIIDVGTALSYQLQATDLSGISLWTINDTVHFSISGTGLLTSPATLAAGSYGLTVTVYDAHNNPTTATFTITVQEETTTPPPPPPIPGFPLAAVALGAALGLGITVVLRHRRRKP